MSVYGGESPAYLDEALGSLAKQTLPAAEVVLVHDGPLPPSLITVIERFRTRLPLREILLPANVGLAAALNAGLAQCSNELVARMDSDDIALPVRLERQSAYMAGQPSIAASSAWVEEFDDSGRAVAIRRLPSEPSALRRFARRRNPLSHPAVIFRRSAVCEAGGYPLRFPEDYALWTLLLVRGHSLGNVPEVLLKMRTGASFLDRRGYAFLRGELDIIRWQRRIGFIGYVDQAVNSLIRMAVRLPPPTVRAFLYRNAR